MSKFERYQKSSRAPASLKADPRRVDEYISLRLKNYAYSLTKNPKKKNITKEAEEELKGSLSHCDRCQTDHVIN